MLIPLRPAGPRPGKLYRSGSLHQLDDADRRDLAALRIGLIVDLRDPAERADSPSDLRGVEATVVHAPVLAQPPAVFLAADTSLDAFYDHIVEERGHALAAVLRLLAASGPTPVLVHCTSGKDRTGLVVALALALAGVDRAAVVADYAASEQHLPSAHVEAILARWPPGANIATLVRLSPPAALERILRRIDERHGSVAGYARAHGLTDEELLLLTQIL
ncbi:tyrosine-protein phosphatase [Dactylosporangium vinaceum]|uniref:Tyrosine-protein phosphatase n=1 Tax=Dactylosporangium vinaceum TaxID=53362 RepID=A0ABV5M337_9ACTN|nr:tyrosine-protein phosphatase [Dactylosporangium vinaceum]UAB99805.1 tyrosine-protein phosphatase [Dactylosporangium vinaceum]